MAHLLFSSVHDTFVTDFFRFFWNQFRPVVFPCCTN